MIFDGSRVFSGSPGGAGWARTKIGISEGGGNSPEELELAVRQIVSRAISSDKVSDIFDAAGLKKPDISILSDEFLAEVMGGGSVVPDGTCGALMRRTHT